MKTVFILLFSIVCSFVLAQSKKKEKVEVHETITIKKKIALNDPSQVTIDTTKVIDTITIPPHRKWKIWGNLGLNISQTSLTNWSAGGEDAFASYSFFSGYAVYQKNKNTLHNYLGLQYGFTHTDQNGFRKSIDDLKLSSKYGYKFKPKWKFSAVAEFTSQIAKGYNYPNDSVKISEFLAPGYLKVGIGLEHKPNKYLLFFFSPMTNKITFVIDDYLSNLERFGVDPGEKIHFEVGPLFKATYRQKIMKNINIESNLDLYTSYKNNFGNIDITWNTFIKLHVNKFIGAKINTSLLYDDDVDYIDKNKNNKGPRIQFKEIIGVGLNYNFGTPKK